MYLCMRACVSACVGAHMFVWHCQLGSPLDRYIAETETPFFIMNYEAAIPSTIARNI